MPSTSRSLKLPQAKSLMSFLAERRKEPGTVSLEEVERCLGAETIMHKLRQIKAKKGATTSEPSSQIECMKSALAPLTR